MEEHQKERYAVAAMTLSKKLIRRNFHPIICENLEEARVQALELIDPKKSVGFGVQSQLNNLELLKHCTVEIKK